MLTILLFLTLGTATIAGKLNTLLKDVSTEQCGIDIVKE